MPKMKSYPSFDDYANDQIPENQPVIGALREFVKRVEPDLTESVMWGNGCWTTDRGPIAYVYSADGYVQFGFMKGSTLDDPKRLLEGKAQYVRHTKVRQPSDIDEEAFAAFLRQAVELGGCFKPSAK